MELYLDEQKDSLLNISSLNTVGQVKKVLRDWAISKNLKPHTIRIYFGDNSQLDSGVFTTDKYDNITFSSKASFLNGRIYVSTKTGLVAIVGDPTQRAKIQTKQLRPKIKPPNALIPQGPIFPDLPGDKQIKTEMTEEERIRYHNLSDAPTVSPNIMIADDILKECSPNVPLHAHQMTALKHILKHRGLLAVHSIGSGKTLVGATASVCFLHSNPNYRVIFIGPKTLLDNFRQTLSQYYCPNGLVQSQRYTYYTYEKFQIDYHKGKIDAYNTMLIIDEAHRLRTKLNKKDTKGKIVRAVMKASRKATKVLLLTATPAVNNPYDLVNLMAIIRGDLTPMRVRDFHLTVWKDKPLHGFADFFRDCIHIYTRTHDQNYPSVDVHLVEIPMSEKYCAEYERVENQSLHPLQADVLGTSDLKPFHNGIRRTVNADIEEFNPKLDWVRSHLLKYNKRKMVIFSPFISLGVMQLELLVADFEIRPEIGVITGDHTEAERQEVIASFNTDQIQVLIISVGAGGLGINLIGTRDVVIMQPGWNDVEMQQAMGRAIRFHSHTHLPKEDQKVEVWKLHLVKENYLIEGLAADQIIENIAIRKQNEVDPFLQQLKSVSI